MFHTWAVVNKMKLNLIKTKEVVFRRPSLRHFLAPAPVSGIEQVGISTFQQDLGFEA